jgi:hypothetical protein
MNTIPRPLPRSAANQDDEHLRLISIFHYVVAGLAVLGIGFLALHYTLMSTVFDNPEMWKDQKGGPPPAELFAAFKWFYLVFGVCLVLGCVANLLSARFIQRRRYRTFSLLVAGINCAQFPFGTALGVFTFIVLLRDSVRERYTSLALSGVA